ncbi:hypothetical protein RINTU1_31800 [Candidatus Regiella insecticola]|uniref:Uncharacterized protein n=1 Tax=Candidatus Regiella insecticola TaxID=138073 RepID=A0A6L2ZSR8_9ENTR|nr:hypothetical protein RINTU1_31800 [Candidatus Regiella insecticola]
MENINFFTLLKKIQTPGYPPSFAEALSSNSPSFIRLVA